MLDEKEKKLQSVENDYLRRDSDIRDLERALEDERRKSMLDVEKIKRLEVELNKRVQEAGQHYQNFAAMQRKSELTAEEIQKIKEEMERERRRTLTEKEQLNRKMREMEKENNMLKEEMENDENVADRIKNEAKELERRQKQLERVLGETNYKAKSG